MKPTYFLLIFSFIFLFSCGGSDEYYGKGHFQSEDYNLFEYGKTCFELKMFHSADERFNMISKYSIYFDSIKTFYQNNFYKLLEYKDIKFVKKIAIAYDIQSAKLDELVQHIQDSILEINPYQKEEPKFDRKWVYFGSYYDKYKDGSTSDYYLRSYYDINHLLYEGDSVCIVIKKGDNSPVYQYVSLNLVTLKVHGIDESAS
jgi:hypothetical protein